MSTVACRLLVLAVLATSGFSQAQTTQPAAPPASPISYEQQTLNKGEPVKIHIARVDLADSRTSVHVVPGGPDPDGGGRYEVTMSLPTALAKEHHFDLTVNAAFADCKDSRDPKTKRAKYRVGMWADALGFFVSDGKVLSDDFWSPTAASLYFTKDSRPHISRYKAIPTDAQNMVTGSHLLVWEGKSVAIKDEVRHPRTLAGIDKEGKLVLVVADGRRPRHSMGLTLADAADVMLDLGCVSAMNLDGGGSSVMIVRENHEAKIKNLPSDGSDFILPLSIERPVAFALGIRVATSTN